MVLSGSFCPSSIDTPVDSPADRPAASAVTETSQASGWGRPAADHSPVGLQGREGPQGRAAQLSTSALPHPHAVPGEGLLSPCPGPPWLAGFGGVAHSSMGSFSRVSAQASQLLSWIAATAYLENSLCRGTQDSGPGRGRACPTGGNQDLRLPDRERGPGEARSTHGTERGALEMSIDSNLNPGTGGSSC